MKQLIAMIALACGSLVANAAVLDGKILKCATDDSFLGPVATSYVFLADGSEQVLVRSSYFGDSVTSYKLQGSKLQVKSPYTSDAKNFIRADMANPNAITTSYSVCLSPGVPDGNSRLFCGAVVESCQLF